MSDGAWLKWNDKLVYEMVELRRQQWDTLIWQIPLLTFTGQAFIFTVILAGGTPLWARTIASLMSVSISVLGLLLLAKHRQAEQADAGWLEQFELEAGWPPGRGQHGDDWIARRDAQLPGLTPFEQQSSAGRRTGWARIPLLPGYKTWVVAHVALIGFALTALYAAIWVELVSALLSFYPLEDGIDTKL